MTISEGGALKRGGRLCGEKTMAVAGVFVK